LITFTRIWEAVLKEYGIGIDWLKTSDNSSLKAKEHMLAAFSFQISTDSSEYLDVQWAFRIYQAWLTYKKLTGNKNHWGWVNHGKSTISMAIFQFAFCMFTRPGKNGTFYGTHWIPVVFQPAAVLHLLFSHVHFSRRLRGWPEDKLPIAMVVSCGWYFQQYIG
jgi:hypothetical protein